MWFISTTLVCLVITFSLVITFNFLLSYTLVFAIKTHNFFSWMIKYILLDETSFDAFPLLKYILDLANFVFAYKVHGLLAIMLTFFIRFFFLKLGLQLKM
jgi:hypothetical protein